MLLVGSQALIRHGKEIKRTPADWDLLGDFKKSNFKVKESRIDLTSINDDHDKTNKDLYEYCQKLELPFVDTPLGRARVAPLEVIKVMKISSLCLGKIKNEEDLTLLGDVKIPKILKDILVRRIKETSEKKEIQRQKFLNRYKIPRMFDHDELHSLINKKPFYKKIITKGFEVNQDLFNNLSFEDKKLLFWEEALVLGLERELIPKIRKAPILVEEIVECFQRGETSMDSPQKWLGRLCVPGNLKDHPEFMAQWGKLNYSKIKGNKFLNWWNSKIQDLPEEFWLKVIQF